MTKFDHLKKSKSNLIEAKIDISKPATIDIDDWSFDIKFAGNGNRTFVNAFNAFNVKYKRRMDMKERGLLSEESITKLEEEQQEDLIDMYCEHVLVDWSGIKDENGKNIKFTPKDAKQFFRIFDKAFAILMVDSSNQSFFAKEVEEKEEKNSEKS